MSNVKVTYQQMNDAAVRLRNGKEEINNACASMLAQINNLISDGFVTDKASPEFHNTYIEFDKLFRQTVESLTGVSQYLDTAAATYRDVDDQLSAALRNQ